MRAGAAGGGAAGGGVYRDNKNTIPTAIVGLALRWLLSDHVVQKP